MMKINSLLYYLHNVSWLQFAQYQTLYYRDMTLIAI